jgi:hypothetical protein
MSNKEIIILLALSMPITLFLGWLMFKIKKKYVRIVSYNIGGKVNEEYTAPTLIMHEEKNGCVSSLANILGIVFFSSAAIGFIPWLIYVILPLAAIGIGIWAIIGSIGFVILLILAFFVDLFHPPR